MYEEFYGLSQLPFQLLPDPHFFYRSQKHEKALTYLEYGVFERAGFIVITGEIGTGKTTLLRYLLRTISEDTPTALINQTFLPPEDFLRMLCQEFSLPCEGKSKSELIELFGTFLIEQYKEGKYVILILDEAQNLPLDTLEEIRMLSNLDADNERLLQIILVGQPPLRNKLQREELRQLLQRVEVSYHLEPLGREDLHDYIRYRLQTAGAANPEIFESAAIDAMYDSTGGVPRLINSMCHRCLVYGFADGREKITADLFEKMLADRRAEGLHAPDSLIPPTSNTHVNAEPSEITENPEESISPAHLAATINRLTEISGASIKAMELAAAKAANPNGDAELAMLKRQLANEKKMREALESRLNRTENDLAHIESSMSQKNNGDQDRSSAPASVPVSPLPPDSTEKGGGLLSLNPIQYIILIIIFIFAITIVGTLVLRHPQGNSINETQPELKSDVQTQKEAQVNVLSQKINQGRAEPEKPRPVAADAITSGPDAEESGPERSLSAGTDIKTRISDTGTSKASSSDRRINFGPSRDQSDTLSEKRIPPQKSAPPSPQSDNTLRADGVQPLTAAAAAKAGKTKRQVSEKIESENYICVVELANVRARPDMKARILGRIRQGTEVRVIGKEGKWMQFKYQGQESAWIYGTLLRPANFSNDQSGER